MVVLKNRSTPALFAAVLSILILSIVSVAQAKTPSVDPAAVETLKRMTEFISGLSQFSVHTENTLEDQLESGQRVDFNVAANVTVQRPNKLHAARDGELVSQEFFYDGKTLTLFNPDENYYASQPAPDTVEKLLDYTREDLGMVIPVSDLVYRNVFDILMQDVTSAVVVGKARIGGVTCDHVAFRKAGVDFQAWVAEGSQPFPCKYVVTDTSTPALISTVSVMSNWNFKPVAGDSVFKFVPPAGAQAIDFMPLDKTSDYGR